MAFLSERLNEYVLFLLNCCESGAMLLTMEQKEAIVATNTRYPRDLHDALQRLARAHRRSFNAEVMWALQQYVHQEGAGIDDAQRADAERSESAAY